MILLKKRQKKTNKYIAGIDLLVERSRTAPFFSVWTGLSGFLGDYETGDFWFTWYEIGDVKLSSFFGDYETGDF